MHVVGIPGSEQVALEYFTNIIGTTLLSTIMGKKYTSNNGLRTSAVVLLKQ